MDDLLALARMARRLGVTQAWLREQAETGMVPHLKAGTEPVLGLASGQFLAAYENNRAAGNEAAIDASPVGKSIVGFIREKGNWSGTATQLLAELESRAEQKTKGLKAWPSSARALGGSVKRLAPNLREAGFGVEFDRSGKQRTRTIELRSNPEHRRRRLCRVVRSSPRRWRTAVE